ncbi:hypothetical protein [Streptomyces gilvus]|uniref:hypothetical protein n=1 Tax=Streptomyces gilvus TaxID=2920937 RepID=UPI001F10EEA7|nr:hypothetical protein [Streptomyces sp. CME 23]MCH5674950.1 hypothetical protein [Streptomyces sp. CME 23]
MMAQKALAAEHPRYGQQAFRSSLMRITEDTFRSVPIEDRVFYHFRDNRDRISNGLPPRRWNP